MGGAKDEGHLRILKVFSSASGSGVFQQWEGCPRFSGIRGSYKSEDSCSNAFNVKKQLLGEEKKNIFRLLHDAHEGGGGVYDSAHLETKTVKSLCDVLKNKTPPR